jgi:hypothetical protein
MEWLKSSNQKPVHELSFKVSLKNMFKFPHQARQQKTIWLLKVQP